MDSERIVPGHTMEDKTGRYVVTGNDGKTVTFKRTDRAGRTTERKLPMSFYRQMAACIRTGAPPIVEPEEPRPSVPAEDIVPGHDMTAPDGKYVVTGVKGDIVSFDFTDEKGETTKRKLPLGIYRRMAANNQAPPGQEVEFEDASLFNFGFPPEIDAPAGKGPWPGRRSLPNHADESPDFGWPRRITNTVFESLASHWETMLDNTGGRWAMTAMALVGVAVLTVLWFCYCYMRFPVRPYGLWDIAEWLFRAAVALFVPYLVL